MKPSDNQHNPTDQIPSSNTNLRQWFLLKAQDIKLVFQKNITHGVMIQVFYVLHDRKHGNFAPDSPHHRQAQQNYRLLMKKNMIIISGVLVVTIPLTAIPIPGLFEIGFYLYCNFVDKLPENFKKTLALEFQLREDLPPELALKEIRDRIKKKIEKTKGKIGRIRSLSRKTSALKNQAKEPRKSKKYKKKL